MATLTFTGVLERHPKLNFVLVEGGIGWIPYLLGRPRFRSGRLGEVVVRRRQGVDAERRRGPPLALGACHADRGHEDRQLECAEEDRRQRGKERAPALHDRALRDGPPVPVRSGSVDPRAQRVVAPRSWSVRSS
ncbi:MAG: hypothetical protein E6J81_19320 [Deltaproteobacteria bacterium]|nr:MAG: hypothetical protein E6J81_19320 [Deltaproteobacteria bacterium]